MSASLTSAKLLRSAADSTRNLHMLSRVILADLAILIYGYVSIFSNNRNMQYVIKSKNSLHNLFLKNRRMLMRSCCLCVCVSALSLLGNGSVNTLQRQEYISGNNFFVGRDVLYTCCIPKDDDGKLV
jgi:hypothetical protein